MAVTYPVLVDGRQPPQISVDWSPDGESVLFSYEGAVLLVDAQTGQTRKIADGGAALWSPTGEWISYVTSQSEPALLNVATGESKVINPGKPTGSVLEWSPDGKYLLIPEGEGSHVPYGCLWVYRVSDGAFVPILRYGMTNSTPHWIQLQDLSN
jgi:Tol biopolymer transport system component